MIILEGSDLVGKSTLAAHLYDCGFEVQHVGRPVKDVDQLQLLTRTKVDNTVFDRHWPSYYVYERCLGLSPRSLTDTEIRTAMAWAADRRVLTVILTAEGSATLALRYINATASGRKEAFGLEDVERANLEYMKIAELMWQRHDFLHLHAEMSTELQVARIMDRWRELDLNFRGIL